MANFQTIARRLVTDGKIATADELFIFYYDVYKMTLAGTLQKQFPQYVQSYYGEDPWETITVIKVVLITASVLCFISAMS